MTAGLVVEPLDSADPSAAAGTCARAVLQGSPSGRAALLVAVGRGLHAGLVAAPWTIDGTIAAARQHGLRLVSTRVGTVAPLDPVARRIAAAEVRDACETDRHAIALRVPGTRRPLRIPRAWIGTSACIVAPMVHHRTTRAGRTHDLGPVAGALATLATATADDVLPEPERAGAWLAARIFARVAVIVDATWWAPLHGDDAGAARLVAVDRCIGAVLRSPLGDAAMLDAGDVDAWIAARLSLARAGSSRVRVDGRAVELSWPSVSLAPASTPSLAQRSIEALWRRPERTALPPPIPGALARAWNAYPERVREIGR